MALSQYPKIQEIISGGYDFKFGDYISNGFRIVQKNLGLFIGYTIVFFALIMVGSLIQVINLFAMLILVPTLTVGFYIAAHKTETGQSLEFKDFFKGFENLGQLVLTYLVMNLIVIASMIPFFVVAAKSGLFTWYMEAMSDPVGMGGTVPQMPPVWSFILFLPALYFGVAYSWAFLFVVFYKMSFWDALEASRQIITKQWFIIFLFALVAGLIAGLGVLLLLVGILFTIPAYYCMVYSAFADVTRLHEEEKEKSDIIDHLV
jgi:hypothetical protein